MNTYTYKNRGEIYMYIYIYKIPWTYKYKYIQMKKSVENNTYITTKITTTMHSNRLYGVSTSTVVYLYTTHIKTTVERK